MTEELRLRRLERARSRMADMRPHSAAEWLCSRSACNWESVEICRSCLAFQPPSCPLITGADDLLPLVPMEGQLQTPRPSGSGSDPAVPTSHCCCPPCSRAARLTTCLLSRPGLAGLRPGLAGASAHASWRLGSDTGVNVQSYPTPEQIRGRRSQVPWINLPGGWPDSGRHPPPAPADSLRFSARPSTHQPAQTAGSARASQSSSGVGMQSTNPYISGEHRVLAQGTPPHRTKRRPSSGPSRPTMQPAPSASTRVQTETEQTSNSTTHTMPLALIVTIEVAMTDGQ